eukprot:gene5213-8815_t
MRRWLSPKRLTLLALGITCAFILLSHMPQDDTAIIKNLPLSEQGKAEPHSDAPLSHKHEDLRRSIMNKQLSKEEEEEKRLGFERNSFNQFVSDRLPLDRQFPDHRHPKCFQQRYYPINALPKTSVIIIFHNEALSTLLRTVWSVINRSPTELIEEILLIDDASTLPWLGQELDGKVGAIPKTRIVRLPDRVGLIQAKVSGAKEARGEVLTFLDSHCECNPGWLVPLLDRIRRDPNVVVAPTIDVISDQTMEYRPAASLHQRGVFSWYLVFAWREQTVASKRLASSEVDPFESPAMAGGLFSISRDYFFQTGGYDTGMEVWGGENLEMSFRIWMCGGRIENVPCSRVGHIFRSTNPVKFKNNDPGTTILRNLNRVANVWMDDYGKIYQRFGASYLVFGLPGSLNGFGENAFTSDISAQLKLRQRLKCHSFQWYLDRIFPDLFVPSANNILFMGLVRNPSGQCFDTKSGSYDNIKDIHLVDCPDSNTPEGLQRASHTRLFFFTNNPTNTLRKIELFSDKCVTVDSTRPLKDGSLPVVMKPCNDLENDGQYKWNYLETGQLYHRVTNTCADSITLETGTLVTARSCKRQNIQQRWTFVPVQDIS